MSRTWRWNISGQVRLISGPCFCHKVNMVSVCVFVTDIRGLWPGQWDERALRPSVRLSVFFPFFLSFLVSVCLFVRPSVLPSIRPSFRH
jgi:hypothetical protein